MNVLFCASECVPFIKTGGLADVIGSLPVALRRAGADVRVMLPKYRIIDDYWKNRMEHVCHFEVLFGWEHVYCGIERVVDNDVTYYFIDNESFFYVDDIYGDGPAEGLRFAFFCRAVLEALPQLGFYPDVLHLNDWQTGLIAALLKTQYTHSPDYARIRMVFSIHNLKYQGLFSWREIAGRLGLDERYFTPDYLEFYGCLSFIKGGLVFADRICTVSPTYAEEIKTAYYGENLDGLLRARENTLSGILNGIDYTIFDPESDRFLPCHYGADSLEQKQSCKRALQDECGLDARDVPLVGMIARLSPQKGLDLVERVLDEMMRCDIQIVFLGKGDRRFVDLLNWANWRYPRRVHARIELDEGLAHRIYAGSDLFLMPSQFEPCGLSQMIALCYGSVPIVRETGGLKDTIQPYNQYTDEGNGFSFTNYNAHEMLYTLERAVRYWRDDKPMWKRLMLRGMRENFGWDNSARRYLELYEGMLTDVRTPRGEAVPHRVERPDAQAICSGRPSWAGAEGTSSERGTKTPARAGAKAPKKAEHETPEEGKPNVRGAARAGVEKALDEEPGQVAAGPVK